MKIKKKEKKKLRKKAIESLVQYSFVISRFREIFGMYDESDKKVVREIKKMIKNYLNNGLDERDDMEKFMDDVDDLRGNDESNSGSDKKKKEKKQNDENDNSEGDILDFDN